MYAALVSLITVYEYTFMYDNPDYLHKNSK